MMTTQQAEQNILTLFDELKRAQERGDALAERSASLCEHVTRLETAVQKLTQEVAALSAVKRGHGPSA